MTFDPATAGLEALRARLKAASRVLRPPPRLDIVEWADRFRFVTLSATPGRWKTREQPVAYGPMKAATEPDTHTVTVMSATQLLKSEFLKNVAYYYIHQSPAPILFVQPTEQAALDFSKERFAPDVERMPELRGIIHAPKAKDSENTIAHKEYPGGPLDFVGANSPTNLASRPKRVILCDEIDKYPPSAGSEGDPLKLAEERASTYRAVGLAKFFRCCSPTVEGESRIGREYAASDRRKCFVACPHCGTEQVLTWASVDWDKDAMGGHLPLTAGIRCIEPDCRRWTENDRKAHAGDWFSAAKSLTWERIERETKWGRPIVVHDFDADRAGQHRGGTGVFAPVLQRLKMLVKYDGTELDAAIINAIFGAYVQSPFDPELVKDAMSDGEELSA